MAANKSIEALAQTLNTEAARLAGVAEVLYHIGEGSKVAESLGLLRDVVDDVNERISEVASALTNGANHG